MPSPQSFAGSATIVSKRSFLVAESMAHLVVIIELLKITLRDEISHDLVAQTNPVVEITEPYHNVMIRDRPILLEA